MNDLMLDVIKAFIIAVILAMLASIWFFLIDEYILDSKVFGSEKIRCEYDHFILGDPPVIFKLTSQLKIDITKYMGEENFKYRKSIKNDQKKMLDSKILCRQHVDELVGEVIAIERSSATK